MNWLRTTTGMMVSMIVLALMLIGVWKFNTIKDAIQTRLYNQKTASSEAHGDSAKVEIAEADTTRAQGVVIRDRFNTLVNSPEVRKNPVATRVATESKKVIANADTEKTHLRNANAQLQKQVNDLETRPNKVEPRSVPYIDALYSENFATHKGVPVIRAGVDYRIISSIKAKLEGSYEPPPAYSQDQQLALKAAGLDPSRPELRATVGLHITF